MSEKSRSESPGAWLAEIEQNVWAMDPRALSALYTAAADGRLAEALNRERDDARANRTLAADLYPIAISDAPVADRLAQVEALRAPGRPRAIKGGVATVSLKGALVPPSGFLAMLFELENPLITFERNLKTAIADPDIGAVIVEIDSPGGVVDGVPEAAAMIRDVRGPKPIVAVANSMAASAAYWLAAQADEVSVTPSGAVGSIGVYTTHRDMSGALKLLGIETTVVSAGKYKAEGHPERPLSEDAVQHMQESVDYFYGLFTSDVAKGRGVKQSDVKAGYGEGRVLYPKAALESGLVDRVETVAEAATRLASRRSASGSRAEDEPEPTQLEAEDDTSGAETAEERDALVAAMADEVDVFLSARAFDKVGALHIDE